MQPTVWHMRLVVGTSVVYPGHGVGRIVTRQKRLDRGAMRDVVVLELSDGLLVTLPLARARELLRPPLSQTDLCQVRETLGLVPPPNEDGWMKRRKDTELKLTQGDPIGLAEVVRDGALRERRALAKPRGSILSASERALNTRARRLLTGEIGLAIDVEPAEADAWINEHLNPSAVPTVGQG
jgi:RNA polymerase-interacting CarD/CdnL/TRCF family regulator